MLVEHHSDFTSSVILVIEYLETIKSYIDNKIIDKNQAKNIIREAPHLIIGISRECVDNIYKKREKFRKDLYDFYKIK